MGTLNDGFKDIQAGSVNAALVGTAITISSRDFALDSSAPVAILSKPGGSTASVATLTSVMPDVAGAYVLRIKYLNGSYADVTFTAFASAAQTFGPLNALDVNARRQALDVLARHGGSDGSLSSVQGANHRALGITK